MGGRSEVTVFESKRLLKEHIAALRSSQENLIEKSDAVIAECVRILNTLRRGDCFCEVGIGNPNQTDHTKACIDARIFVEHWNRVE